MKPPKKKPAATECGLSGADAQDAYEQTLAAGGSNGAPRAKDLADHIAGCGPCSSALYALELQGDAVSTLAGKSRGAASDAGSKRGAGGTGGTAIESILRVAARSGTNKLADLAYELAKACLIRLPNLERLVRRVVEPREAEVVAGELRTASERQGSVAVTVKLTGIPTEAPAEADALRAATSCLKILEQVEGATPRQVLGMSQVHIFEKRPESAETLLQRLLEQRLSPAMSSYARINLMQALNRQEKYEESVAIGDAALLHDGNNWQILYNLAVAHAYLKNHAELTKISSRLAKLVSSSSSVKLRELLESETPRFADELSEEPSQVARQFGIVPVRRSRRNAS